MWQISESNTIVASTAAAGSPLAATLVSLFGTDYVSSPRSDDPQTLAHTLLFYQRIVFFYQENGELMATNRTSSQNWSAPFSILSNDKTQPGTQALDVIQFPGYSTDALTIRVYYGSFASNKESQIMQLLTLNNRFGDWRYRRAGHWE